MRTYDGLNKDAVDKRLLKFTVDLGQMHNQPFMTLTAKAQLNLCGGGALSVSVLQEHQNDLNEMKHLWSC